VLIAPSFGAIFQGNCIRNGLLPVELPLEQVQALAAWVSAAPQQHQVTVDLVACEVRTSDGRVWPFVVPEVARSRLLEGRDEIAETLTHAPVLAEWRERDRLLRPWVYAGETG
jgi:3-isopropylmalate/(R)-2-methylmalate dehydratase small subunit